MTDVINLSPLPSWAEMGLHKPTVSTRQDIIDALIAVCSDEERDSCPGENSSLDDGALSIVSPVNATCAGSEGDRDVDLTLDGGESTSLDLDETAYMDLTEAHAGEPNMTEEPFEPEDELSLEQILAVSALSGGPSTSVCLTPGAAPTGDGDRQLTSTPIPEVPVVASPVEANPPDPGALFLGIRFARRPSVVARERLARAAKNVMADKKYPK